MGMPQPSAAGAAALQAGSQMDRAAAAAALRALSRAPGPSLAEVLKPEVDPRPLHWLY